jgi:hypothetical protein
MARSPLQCRKSVWTTRGYTYHRAVAQRRRAAPGRVMAGRGIHMDADRDGSTELVRTAQPAESQRYALRRRDSGNNAYAADRQVPRKTCGIEGSHANSRRFAP